MASQVTRRFLSTTARRLQDAQKNELKKETKRNPETLVRHNASVHSGRPIFCQSIVCF